MTEVLLVEDDPAARQGLELALRRLGYGVRPAETGEAALNLSLIHISEPTRPY